MRVLLTGHEGYLGVVVARWLSDRGHDVVGLDVGYFRGCDLGPAPPALPRIGRDVRDVEANELRGFDAVVHLAALSNDPLGNLAPEVTHDINVVGSTRLAHMARDAGVGRFVFASSCSIYGATTGDVTVDESAPLKPVTGYAESKARMERLLRDLSGREFCTVSLRNATVYGFSPRLRTDLVVNDLVASALLDGEVRVLSDGTPWRPVIHVEDVAEVVARMLDAPSSSVNGEAFNVGSASQNHQVLELAEIVGATVGAKVVITGERGPDPRSYRVDFSKLHSALPGFRAGWDVAKGAEQLVDRYRHFELSSEEIRTRFTRLARLQALRSSGELDSKLRWTHAMTLPVEHA